MTVRLFSSQKPIALLLETPLYEQFEFEGEDNWSAIDFLFIQQTYDNYCVACKRDSTFQITASNRPQELKRNPAKDRLMASLSGAFETVFAPVGVHRINAQCTRHKSHAQYFVFCIDQKHEYSEEKLKRTYSTIQKIGQYPSYADIHIASVKRYAPVLSKAKLGEMVRAIGLASHGVGIGAYVYLRRIFESLIEEAHLVAKISNGWDEDIFLRARMSEKIGLLKSNLPTFLVEQANIYGLLSKGIHELSEEECLENFATLRIGIELILDEKIARKHHELKVAEARAAFGKLKQLGSHCIN